MILLILLRTYNTFLQVNKDTGIRPLQVKVLPGKSYLCLYQAVTHSDLTPDTVQAR